MRPVPVVIPSAAAFLALLLGTPVPLTAGGTPVGSPNRAAAIGVIDGDSLVLSIDGREEEARLEGIDAPELSQPFGREARAVLSYLVLHRELLIVKKGADQYGRLLIDAKVGTTNVNHELVLRGLAWHFTRYSSDEALAAAQVSARERRVGLWALPGPVAPWEYRDRSRGPLAPESGGALGIVGGQWKAPEAAAVVLPLRGNRRSLVVHRPGCRNYDCGNCVREFPTLAAAEAVGYRAAGCCKGGG